VSLRTARPAIDGGDILTRSDALLVSCEGGADVLFFVKPLANLLFEQLELAIKRRLSLGRGDRLQILKCRS
jgi:hypothetical protein